MARADAGCAAPRRREAAAGVAMAGLRGRLLFFFAASLIGAACIPEPPTDLPESLRSRPTILRTSVVPSPSNVIGRWPDSFIVPVEVGDPNEPFVYVAFIDYNAATFTGRQFSPLSDDRFGRVRTVEINLTEPSATRCHVVDVIVARSFDQDRTARRPDNPPGGDIVSWFYSPGGTLQGCPSPDVRFDGGASAEGGPP